MPSSEWELFRGTEAKKSIRISGVPDGTRIIVVSDAQVPLEDTALLRTIFRRFAPDYRPKHGGEYHLFLNGDILDAFSLSRFVARVQPRFDVGDEIDLTKAYLKEWGKLFTHKHFVFGNHEARWDKWLWEQAPQIARLVPPLAEMLELDKLGYDYVPYLKHFNFQGFIITHGDRTSVNVAKDMLMTYHTSGTSGHVNRPQSFSYANAAGADAITWYCTGHTCRPDIGDVIKDWARVQAWQQGFLIGEVRDGVLYPELVRVHHGRFTAGGKIYAVEQ